MPETLERLPALVFVIVFRRCDVGGVLRRAYNRATRAPAPNLCLGS